MTSLRIPHFGLARQYSDLAGELMAATDAALSSGCLVRGPYLKEFETWLEKKTGARHAVVVHSGTQALEIIARFKYEQERRWYPENVPTIVLPNLTYPATLNAFLSTGWAVELADTDWNGILSHASIRDPRKTYCYVGLYGRMPFPAQMYKGSYSIVVDGAQHWLAAGSNTGTGMAVSFDPTKNLPSSGNGGAIITDNFDMYQFAVKYRDHGKDPKHQKSFITVGSNSVMSEQECAQILIRCSHIEHWQARREKIAAYWVERFRDLPIKCLSADEGPHAHQKFAIYVHDRKRLAAALTERGIECRASYDFTLGDLDTTEGFVKPDLLSNSVMLSRGVLALPMYPELNDTEVEYIAEAVRQLNTKYA